MRLRGKRSNFVQRFQQAMNLFDRCSVRSIRRNRRSTQRLTVSEVEQLHPGEDAATPQSLATYVPGEPLP